MKGIQYLQEGSRAESELSMMQCSICNLTYRRKADLECGDDAARKADLAKADEWIQKAMGARKANELKKEKKTQGGVTMQ